MALAFLVRLFLDLFDQRVGLKLRKELVNVRVPHRNVHAGACRKHFSGRNRAFHRYGVRAYEVAQDLRAAAGGGWAAATGQP